MRRCRKGRRIAAGLAIGAAVVTLAAGLVVAVDDFPRGLLILMFGLLAAAGSWEGVLRRGWARAGALTVAVLALAVGVLLLADEGFLRALLALAAALLVRHVGARIAFDPRGRAAGADRCGPPRHLALGRRARGRDRRVPRAGQDRSRSGPASNLRRAGSPVHRKLTEPRAADRLVSLRPSGCAR